MTITPPKFNTPEHQRLEDARIGAVPWKASGPYLSERQWGTVREDYSENGDAWNYFSHDQARSRAYRWGEDGIAGVCDERQRLCLALALWNGADPLLKERMFGLNNGEGNHGEDVKEYWFYLDSTPTHSYMKCQYKYPQREFPYNDLLSTNRSRSKQEMEYELLDTGIFDEDRYFDVVVEYAKADHDDILMLVTAHNRGPETATLHLLPTLWFRNTWSWGDDVAKPTLAAADGMRGVAATRASHPELGEWLLRADSSAQLLFCENDTNNERLFGAPNASPYVKDGVNEFIVHGAADAINPERTGTKVAAHHVLEVPAGASASIRVRLTASDRSGANVPGKGKPLGADFDQLFKTRRKEADELRDGDPADAAGRRGDGDAPGAGGVAVGQAVLRVQRASVAARAWRRPVGSERRGELGAQRALVPHGLARRHLNAKRVGVPVVRGVGPRIPLRTPLARRRRLRQGAGRAAARHPLPAPQRPNPGVRVELQRRQPAGDRVGGPTRVRARGRDPRRGRHRVPGPRVRPAADELHLVGQSQGPR